MPATDILESREMKLDRDIDLEIDRIRALPAVVLPKAVDRIVQMYVQKVEGAYDVSHAKKDTDNAIDLLYIAYNTTPVDEGAVRNEIDAVMHKLIDAQQASERTMSAAAGTAHELVGSLDDLLPDWQDVKAGQDSTEIKTFVGHDLVRLATGIQAKALEIQAGLLSIAKLYDDIIADTDAVTKKSQLALSARLERKAAVLKVIADADAERERLESLVADLQGQVTKFDQMARDFEARAESEEERSFIMSIISTVAQTVAAAIPAMAMAGSGSGSMLAASKLNTPAPKSSEGKDTPAPAADDTARQIETRKKISESQAAQDAAKKQAEGLKKDIQALEAEKTDKQAPAEAAAVAQRIDAKKTELGSAEGKVSALEATLSALRELDQGLDKREQEHMKQAGSLREMQMQMLAKAEDYEKERRNQAAELVKIKALLKSNLDTQEKIQLAVQSLCLSVSALKRMREIVVEIAAFFKSFADFMGIVAREAQGKVKSFEDAAGKEVLRKNALQHLVESTDDFFIRQCAEWQAAYVISDRFIHSFAEGWSRLNKLNGDYRYGKRLDDYMAEASDRVTEIAQERQAAADRKIADIELSRQRLRGAQPLAA